ncbi:MAG: SpoIIE family protein phosphatase, partial [Candidatus Omnitrophica bacterium]|nr:SpoIIE family protein phosphatase [Candidatus Omnitrophota bacterium]
MPAYLGYVKDSFMGTGRKIVIQIQDAHCNYYAQRSISDLVGYFANEYGIESVNLEGGSGEYDLSLFTEIRDPKDRAKVTDYFVKEGLLNGGESFAVNNPGKVKLWGVEDPDLYLDNLAVYRDSLAYKTKVDKWLQSLRHILTNLKPRIYSKDLIDFDIAHNAYKEQGMEFKDYLETLLGYADKKGVTLGSFPAIGQLKQALDREKFINFKKADIERDALIDKLQKSMSKKDLKELMAMTLEFKEGRLGPSEFYLYLIKKARGVEANIKDYPKLNAYIGYVSMYEMIDKAALNDEMARLEEAVRQSLCENDTQRHLAELCKDLIIMKNIFEIKITRDDYKYYLAHKDRFDINNYIRFVDREAPKYSIQAKLDNDITSINVYIEKIGSFYDYSFKRDDAFLRNIIFGGEKLKAAIIVTGGFHTENLCDLFRKSNISYISIVPTFRSEEGYVCPYFSLLAGTESDMTGDLYRAIASMSSIQVASMLSTAMAPVWGDNKIIAFRAAIYVQRQLVKGRTVRITLPDGKMLMFGDSGKTVTMSLARLVDRVHQVDIDRPIREAYRAGKAIAVDAAMRAEAAKRIRAMAGALSRQNRVNADKLNEIARQVQSGELDINLVDVGNAVFDAHAGGQGIHINAKYASDAKKIADLIVHEAVAGITGDHFIAEAAESWKPGNELPPLDGAAAMLDKPVWAMARAERRATMRDYMQAAAMPSQGAQPVRLDPVVKFELKEDGVTRKINNSQYEAIIRQLIGSEVQGTQGIKALYPLAGTIVVTRVSYIRSGAEKDVFRVEAMVDGKPAVFGLRVYRTPGYHAFEREQPSIAEIADKEVKQFRDFRELDGVAIFVKGMVSAKEFADAERDKGDPRSFYNQLSDNRIGAFSFGEFLDGVALDEISDPQQRKAAYRDAVKTVIRGWLLTFDNDKGVSISDLYGKNLVRRENARAMGEPVQYVDLGMAQRSTLEVLMEQLRRMYVGDGFYTDENDNELNNLVISAVREGINDFFAREAEEKALKREKGGTTILQVRKDIAPYASILRMMAEQGIPYSKAEELVLFTPPTGPVAHAEAMELKTGAGRESEKVVLGRRIKAEFKDPAGVETFGERLKAAGIALEIMPTVNKRPLKVVVDEELQLSEEDVGNLISEALARLGKEGDINRLPPTLVMTMLDSSTHMFEDHLYNGFIGVNRAITRIAKRETRRIVLSMGLVHELSHELSGQTGKEFETAQLSRDALYAARLMRNAGISFNDGMRDLGNLLAYKTFGGYLEGAMDAYAALDKARVKRGAKLTSTERTEMMQARVFFFDNGDIASANELLEITDNQSMAHQEAMQKALERVVPGIGVYHKQLQGIGGDWHRQERTSDGRFTVMQIADAMGHGIMASPWLVVVSDLVEAFNNLPAEEKAKYKGGIKEYKDAYRDINAPAIFEAKYKKTLMDAIAEAKGDERMVSQALMDYYGCLQEAALAFTQKTNRSIADFMTYTIVIVDAATGTAYRLSAGSHNVMIMDDKGKMLDSPTKVDNATVGVGLGPLTKLSPKRASVVISRNARYAVLFSDGLSEAPARVWNEKDGRFESALFHKVDENTGQILPVDADEAFEQKASDAIKKGAGIAEMARLLRGPRSEDDTTLVVMDTAAVRQLTPEEKANEAKLAKGIERLAFQSRRAPGALDNRDAYEERLVAALQRSKGVQVGYFKIQNFKGDFNDMGKRLGVGSHALGDAALDVIGRLFQEHFNRALAREAPGVTCEVYNMGPEYFLIFKGVSTEAQKQGIQKALNRVIDPKTEEDLAFKRAVIKDVGETILPYLDKEVAPQVYERMLKEIGIDMVNMYGGLSEVTTSATSPEKAPALADELGGQASKVAKAVQLRFSPYYKSFLEAAMKGDAGRAGEEMKKLLSLTDESGAKVRRQSGLGVYSDKARKEYELDERYGLSNEYAGVHAPIHEQYDAANTYEILIKNYQDALARGVAADVEVARRALIMKMVLYRSKNISERDGIFRGNDNFKALINYIFENPSLQDMEAVFRIGGDEFGAVAWDNTKDRLDTARIDGNNIGAT